MKSIYNYQEQLEIIRKTNESFDLDNDLAQYGMTEEYYKKIALTSDLLKEFVDKYLATPNIVSDIQDLAKTNCPDLMGICVMVDVLRCYDGLNHPTSFTTPEGIALLIILCKIHHIGGIYAFKDLSCVGYQTISLTNLIPHIDDCSQELGNRQDLLVSKILEPKDIKLDRLYRVLLYKLCQSIAEVDGTISVEEKEWLEMIARLDDDDLSNDINVDSL